MSKQTRCHTGYNDPTIKYKTKFQEDINVQKTDTFISLELDDQIDGMCVLNKNYMCCLFYLYLICISLNKGSIKFKMILKGSIAKKVWEPLHYTIEQ